MNKGEAHILIAANSVNGTKGGLGSSYLGTIINNYAAELRAEYPDAVSASGSAPSIRIDMQGLFNPNLNYKLYIDVYKRQAISLQSLVHETLLPASPMLAGKSRKNIRTPMWW